MEIKDLDFSKIAEKVDYIPKNRGSENPIRKKILYFLGEFTIGEIQRLKCVNGTERNQLCQRIRYYATELLPKMFIIASREDDGDYVYIKRKPNIEVENCSEELHNKH